MAVVSLGFLFVIIAVLGLLALSIFFIVFGIVKKMKGFVIAGVALILLFVAFFVMLLLLNIAANI